MFQLLHALRTTVSNNLINGTIIAVNMCVVIEGDCDGNVALRQTTRHSQGWIVFVLIAYAINRSIVYSYVSINYLILININYRVNVNTCRTKFVIHVWCVVAMEDHSVIRLRACICESSSAKDQVPQTDIWDNDNASASSCGCMRRHDNLAMACTFQTLPQWCCPSWHAAADAPPLYSCPCRRNRTWRNESATICCLDSLEHLATSMDSRHVRSLCYCGTVRSPHPSVYLAARGARCVARSAFCHRTSSRTPFACNESASGALDSHSKSNHNLH